MLRLGFFRRSFCCGELFSQLSFHPAALRSLLLQLRLDPLQLRRTRCQTAFQFFTAALGTRGQAFLFEQFLVQLFASLPKSSQLGGSPSRSLELSLVSSLGLFRCCLGGA